MNIRELSRKPLRIIIAFVLVGLCLPVAAFAVYNRIDRAICVRRVSGRLGTAESFAAIRTYVLESVTPGMSRTAVMEVLVEIGQTVVIAEHPDYQDDKITLEIIQLRMCGSPFNNPQLYLYYDNGSLLTSRFIIDD